MACDLWGAVCVKTFFLATTHVSDIKTFHVDVFLALPIIRVDVFFDRYQLFTSTFFECIRVDVFFKRYQLLAFFSLIVIIIRIHVFRTLPIIRVDVFLKRSITRASTFCYQYSRRPFHISHQRTSSRRRFDVAYDVM